MSNRHKSNNLRFNSLIKSSNKLEFLFNNNNNNMYIKNNNSLNNNNNKHKLCINNLRQLTILNRALELFNSKFLSQQKHSLLKGKLFTNKLNK